MGERHAEYSARDWRGNYELPKTPKESFEHGQSYYDEFLKPVMAGFEKQIEAIQHETANGDASTACIFLDRDARPALHAWEQWSDDRYIKNMPMPFSQVMLPYIFEDFGSFRDEHFGNISNPDEWAEELKKHLDARDIEGSYAQKFSEVFEEKFGTTLKDRELLVLVDIGYHGSAAELATYLLKKAFPEKTVKTVLLYKYTQKVPTRGIVSDQTTWGAESAIPHRTTGYEIGGDENKLKYLRGEFDHENVASQKIETAFYKGVMKAAKEDKLATSE